MAQLGQAIDLGRQGIEGQNKLKNAINAATCGETVRVAVGFFQGGTRAEKVCSCIRDKFSVEVRNFSTAVNELESHQSHWYAENHNSGKTNEIKEFTCGGLTFRMGWTASYGYTCNDYTTKIIEIRPA